MLIRKIIEARLFSSKVIFNKNHEKVDDKILSKEYLQIKNLLFKKTAKNQIVALYLTNEYHYLLAIMACMDIGICYIPLKSNWPDQRVSQIKELTGFEFLLTDVILTETLRSEENPSVFINYETSDDSPLYIMFTSGSTGEPKGVVIRRKSYENFLMWIDEYFPEINSEDRLLNSTGYTFDVSLMEVGLFLVKNVQFFCSNLEQNSLIMGKEISDLAITVAVTVPNNFNLVLSERIFPELNLASLKHVLLAGSKITPALFERFQHLLPKVDLYNCYGPTEATIYCLAKKLTNTELDVSRNTVSIGVPIRGCSAIVLKDNGQKANPYEMGELLIGGVQLMRDYFNRPELTANTVTTFENVPFYKTGDFVFQNETGEYFVSGRTDDTVKVSAQRVNLSDVDGYIANLPYIEEVATIAIDDIIKDSILICFIVLSDKAIAEKTIKEDLKKCLLGFQIPSKIYLRDELPLNNSGKISKKMLKEEYLKK